MYRKQIAQKTSPTLQSTPTSKDILPSRSYGSLSAVVQRVQQDPNSVGEDERQQLESAIGTRSMREILAGKQTPWVPEFQGISAQLGTPIQAKRMDDVGMSEVQPENKTGLPDHLKAGIENLSGMAIDDVSVHYNSSQPSQLQALAYTQGSDIHVAPGQEKHLPHEAWHVVQQKQGRVKPTIQAKGVGINDDQGLEKEADVMGTKALQMRHSQQVAQATTGRIQQRKVGGGSTAVIQRVGGVKIGFDYNISDNTDVKDGQELLKTTWENARQDRHNAKIGNEKTDVEEAAQEIIDVRKRAKEREEYKANQLKEPGKYPESVDVEFPEILANKTKRGFSQYYAQMLTSINKNKQEKLLKATEPFKDGKLQIAHDNVTIEYNPKAKPYVKADYIKIATLKRGTEAFTIKFPATTPGSARDIYLKYGIDRSFTTDDPKEYVKDSRGVMTRRYAYVEKNYYQMMEFFMTHHMEGRFQSYMRAAGATKPNIYEHRDEGVDLVRGSNKPKDEKVSLTIEQLAVAHQKLGSGPQQRGVSLTATPKVNATYVNTGENFRTNRGFRLKVDLSKVPHGLANSPLLINHYSEGGVIDAEKQDQGYDTSRVRGEKSKYPYKESSIHARELLLEHLKPEWIVAIEYHDQDNKTGVGTGSTIIDTKTDLKGKKSILELAKEQFGGNQYQAGFNFGLRRDKNVVGINPHFDGDKNFQEGFEGARLFVTGWTEGQGEYNRSGRMTDEGERLTTGLTMPQHIYDQTMKKKEHEDKFDFYRMGYLRGRSGKALITSHADLPKPK